VDNIRDLFKINSESNKKVTSCALKLTQFSWQSSINGIQASTHIPNIQINIISYTSMHDADVKIAFNCTKVPPQVMVSAERVM
jgi:hypothetical protein